MSAYSGTYEQIRHLIATDYSASGVTLAELATLLGADGQAKNRLTQALNHLKTKGRLRSEVRKPSSGRSVLVYFPVQHGEGAARPPATPKRPARRGRSPAAGHAEASSTALTVPSPTTLPITLPPRQQRVSAEVVATAPAAPEPLCCTQCWRPITPEDALAMLREGTLVFAEPDTEDGEDE